MHLHGAIENVISKSCQRWRWQRFLRLSIGLAAVVSGAVLILGLGMVIGLLATKAVVIGWLLMLVLGATLGWMVIAVRCAAALEDRSTLAASIERAHPPLMDRLNTLVFLQQQGGHPAHPYAECIERQARSVIAQASPDALWLRPHLPAILARLGILAAVVLLTLLFYAVFQPWQHLKGAQDASLASQEEPALEIPPPKEPLPESPREEPSPPEGWPWGEIRITKPGGDVRATPLDTVPLEIEAASNRPLKQVEWSASINGGAPQRNELPPPADSRFAAYQPELDLKALGAKEWDVVSYSARAISADGKIFESDVYFVEVAPPGEERVQIPGGREGPSYSVLERLTEMIQRQAEVIRQTHRQEQPADASAGDRQPHREALAREEGDLSDSAVHLAADAEAELDEPLLAALEGRLQQAATTLGEAQRSLLGGRMDESLHEEEKALAALTAARQQFRKNLLKDFADAHKRTGERAAGEPAEDVDAARRDSDERGAQLTKRLAQLRSRQKQLQSVREMLKNTLESQRDLDRNADLRSPSTRSRAAQRQRELLKSLQECLQRNSSITASCQAESASAQAAMDRAAGAMQAGQSSAFDMAEQAAAEIQKLDDVLRREEERAGLAAAHQLKRMLDYQIDQLNRAEQQGSSPAAELTPQRVRQLAESSKSIVGEMKKLADEMPTSARFGQPLRDALRDENKQQLDAWSDRLAQAEDAAARRKASGQLRKGLEQVSRAFDASCPATVGGSRRSPLKPKGTETLAEGRREVLAAIEGSLASVFGLHEYTEDVPRKVQERPKRPKILFDVHVIDSLLRQIEPLLREVAPGTTPAPKEAKQTHIDPVRLPPAYRKSIEKYFQKLSEQP